MADIAQTYLLSELTVMQICTLLDSLREEKVNSFTNGKRGIPLQGTSVAKWEKEKLCLDYLPS